MVKEKTIAIDAIKVEAGTHLLFAYFHCSELFYAVSRFLMNVSLAVQFGPNEKWLDLFGASTSSSRDCRLQNRDIYVNAIVFLCLVYRRLLRFGAHLQATKLSPSSSNLSLPLPSHSPKGEASAEEGGRKKGVRNRYLLILILTNLH